MKRYTLNAAEKAFSDKAAELLNQGYQVLPCAGASQNNLVQKPGAGNRPAPFTF